ncbi:MAG: SDR family NAD(P)-dependent oxidoreductase [Thermoleophilia bacterium]|nr:SDR family NAD(P)-dependent oxidoreductase [Thermoleophilia bacterium]
MAADPTCEKPDFYAGFGLEKGAGKPIGGAIGSCTVGAVSDKQKKTVLITGCSTGIGRATAERLAGRGWNVYATARRLDSIADLEASGCKLLELDVTSEDSMTAAVQRVEQAEGAVYGLVNNAGYSQSGAVETVDGEQMRRQFETNVFGLVRLCQLVLPAMRERREGRIVNISSMGGRMTFPGGGIYHATKYAVEAISDALRFEVAGFGVKVVLVEPGLITTNFADAAVGSMDGVLAGDGTAASPYDKFNNTVAASTTDIYTGPMRHLGAGPEAVAKTIEHVLRRRGPRARYTVTPSAKLSLAARAVTPDRLWDAAMGAAFPRPGR